MYRSKKAKTPADNKEKTSADCIFILLDILKDSHHNRL
jgi:hypothetical protein